MRFRRMKEALLYEPQEGGKVVCTACARYCRIGDGQIGLCGIRKNIDGKLFLLVYGKVITGHIDPIEKKPVTHYMPGSKIFSIATTGCNWLCHPAGTEIALSDGSKRPIEKIAPGDGVWSYDAENNMEIQPSVVTHVETRFAQLWEVRYGSRGAGRILLTEEHPVLTQTGWKTVRELKPGDRILKVWYQNTESWKRHRSITIQNSNFHCKRCGETVKGLSAWNRHRGDCYTKDLEVPLARRKAYSKRMKTHNPMRDPDVARRALRTSKERFLADPGHGWHRNVKRLRHWLHRHPSKGQLRLYDLLDELGVSYEKEYRIHPEKRLSKSRKFYIADAAVLEESLDIEVDGWWHFNNERVARQDRVRDETLKSNGWQVLRIPGSYVFNHPEEVKALIMDRLSRHVMVNARRWLEVRSVKATDRMERVFSMETLPNHNYVADGILVHNCQYCFPGDIGIATDLGVLPIGELWGAGRLLSSTTHGDVVGLRGINAYTHRGRLRPATQAYRHFYSGDLLEFHLEGMSRLRCTPDHRLFAARNPSGAIRKVPALDLRRGDLLAIPKSALGHAHTPSLHAGPARIIGESSPLQVQVLAEDALAGRVIERREEWLVPIRELKASSYIGYVYNLAVSEDHSYVANQCAVSNCQNFDISQRRKVEGIDATPQQVVDMTLEHGCQGIAYTYNQPTIFIEYAHDIGVLAREQGLVNIFVSNGYDTPDTVRLIGDFLDCITVDFKGSAEPKFTRRYIGVMDPQPIFDSLVEMRDKTDVHIEITDLIVPQVGDDLAYARKLSQFVYDELGPETPIHFLRFHPDYKMMDLPSTPVKTLEKHHAVAKETGLQYAYVGNVPGHPLEHTYCAGCGEIAIRRHGFDITGWNLDEENRCRACGHRLPIVGGLQDSWREFRFRPVMYR